MDPLACSQGTERVAKREGSLRLEFCQSAAGVPDGEWRSLRENGAPLLVGRFSRGQRVGEWQELDGTGAVTARHNYDRDGALTDTIDHLTSSRPIRSRVTVFRADGSVENEKHLVDGLLEGHTTHWDPQGAITRVDTYRRGRLVDSRPDAEVFAIQAAFDNLVAALNGGGRASPFVDDDTLNRYDDLHRSALFATSADIRSRSLTDQMIIVRLRHEVAASELPSLSPSDLVERGLLPPLFNPTPTSRIADIERTDTEHATGALVRDGEPIGVRVSLVKIAGRWRVSLFSLFAESDRLYEELAKRRGYSLSVCVERMVQLASGRPVPSTIWDPPNPP